jgi:drug/metabolite transporter (DMT)-like permease
MDQVTFYWAVAATILGGIQLFFQKVVAQEKRDSAFNGFMMYGASAIAIYALLFAQHELPDAWRVVAILAFVGGGFHGLGNFVRIEALKHIDSVLYFPINKVLGPLLVVFAGVLLLGDSLTLQQYIGIGLGLAVPLLLLSAAEHHRQNNLRRGLVFVIISTVLTAASVIFTKQATSYDATVLFVLAIAQTAGAISSIAILIKQKDSGLSLGAHLDRRDIVLGLIAALIGFFSAYTLIRALSTGLVSLVYAIHAHYIIIPIVLSIWWYGDHINFRKVVAIVVSFLAIILLYSA